MFRSFSSIVCSLGMFVLFAASAQAAVVTVTSTDTDGWFGMDQAGAATGALTTTEPYGPGGTGSLEYSTSGDMADQIHAARIVLAPANGITAVGYSFWSSDGVVAPTLKLQYWSPTRFGTLVYEPEYNGAFPTNTWVDVDASQGSWWSTEFGQPDERTFAAWQTELGSTLVNLMQVGVGSGWSQAMTGHADMVRLATATADTTWDFEGAAVLPPPPATDSQSIPTLSGWAAILMALLLGSMAFAYRKRLF